MAIAEAMKNLADNIITSYDTRIKAIGNIVAETHETLSGFAESRKKMAEELFKSLGDFVNKLKNNTEDLLTKFQSEHKEMSSEQAKGLSDFVKNLTDTVGSMLSESEKERKDTFKKMMGNITKEIKDIENYVSDKLKEFNEAHADMSEELKKSLSIFVGDLVNNVKNLLDGFRTDIKEAKDAWQNMVGTMEKARESGIIPGFEASAETSTVQEIVEKIKSKKRKGGRKKKAK